MEPEPPEGIVSATRMISASAEKIFDLIADPSIQPSWDGNNNLASAAPGQRVHQVGDVFKTTLTNGAVRENHVVEFIEGSKIAWRPAEPGKQPPGHLWRWELSEINPTLTSVTHTYDWTSLTDQRPAGEGSFDDARHAARVNGPSGHAGPEHRRVEPVRSPYGSPSTWKRPRGRRYRCIVRHR